MSFAGLLIFVFMVLLHTWQGGELTIEITILYGIIALLITEGD